MAYLYKIGVSGSVSHNVTPGAYAKSRELGRQITLAGMVCVAGDMVDLPLAALHGAKMAGGITLGISGATSRLDYERKYRFCEEETDMVIYAGSQYSGRNLLFVRACDAVVFVCFNTSNWDEFDLALEDKKPIGIVLSSNGITPEIEHSLERARRAKSSVVCESDPNRLVHKLLSIIVTSKIAPKTVAKVTVGGRARSKRIISNEIIGTKGSR